MTVRHAYQRLEGVLADSIAREKTAGRTHNNRKMTKITRLFFAGIARIAPPDPKSDPRL